jgi:hypothetical protein
LDGEAEILQAGDKAECLCRFGPAVEVSGAEIAVEFTADQHVIDGGQDRSSERPVGLFDAAAGAQAMELCLELAGLLAGGGDRTSDEGGVEPSGTFARPGGALQIRLLVYPGDATKSGGGQKIPLRNKTISPEAKAGSQC